MSDLISRQNAVNMIKGFIADATSHGITPRLDPYYIMNGIENLPSAEKTGHLESVLEDIKAEIADIKDFEVVNGGVYVREFEVSEIIDKHMRGTEND